MVDKFTQTPPLRYPLTYDVLRHEEHSKPPATYSPNPANDHDLLMLRNQRKIRKSIPHFSIVSKPYFYRIIYE
jgi:hypothetical protein